MAGKTIAAMVKRLRGANKGKWVKTYFPNQQRFKAAMARDASRIKPIKAGAGGELAVQKTATKQVEQALKRTEGDIKYWKESIAKQKKFLKASSSGEFLGTGPAIKKTIAKQEAALKEAENKLRAIKKNARK